MEALKMIKALLSDTLNTNLYEPLTSVALEQPNNFFEVITNKYPLKPFVDLDGSFDNGISKQDFETIDIKIQERLKTLDGISIMTSSHYDALKLTKQKDKTKREIVVKLSYRIVWINEYVENIKIMKTVVQESKAEILQNLLSDIIPVTMKSAENSLNIDFSVYRDGVGKIRCANAYKYPEQKERINKIIKGSIEDSFINICEKDIKNLNLIIPQKEGIKIHKKEIRTKKEDEKQTEKFHKKEEKQSKKEAREEEVQSEKFHKKVDKQSKKEAREEAEYEEKAEQKAAKKLEKTKEARDFTQIEIIQLLKVIGNNADWDRWNTVGLILHDNLYDFSVFRNWSQLSKKNDSAGTEIQWEKYPEPAQKWVIFSLLKYAKEDNPEGYALWCKSHNKPHIISVLKQGVTLFDEEYSKQLFINLKYSKSEWYSCESNTKLWSIDERAESSILQFVLLELRKDKNEGQMRLFESGSFLNLLLNCLKKSLCDDEFYAKLETPIDCVAFKNGLYNLKTKAFQRGFKSNDYISKTLDYDFDESYKQNPIIYEDIISQLTKLMNNNPEDYDYIMRVVGYTLTGRANEQQQFYSCIGQKGGNGKTTIFEIITKIFKIYVKKVTPKCFEADYAKVHKDLASIQGARFLVNEEFKKGAKLNEQLVKIFRDGLTTENEIMFGTSKLLKLNCKLFFTSNATLTFEGDGGMNRGYRQINFNSRFVENVETSEFKHEKLCFKADKTFNTKFDNAEYRDTLLHIIMNYAHKYYTDGLITPKYITDESETTCALQGDSFMTFFEDNYVVKKDGTVFRCDFENLYTCERRKQIDIKTAKDEFVRISDAITYDRNKKGSGPESHKRGCFVGFELKSSEALETIID